MSSTILPVEELIHQVDYVIMEEIRKEKSGLVLGLYLYFDTPDRPVDPREFLEFWNSMTMPEKVYALTPSSRWGSDRPQMSPGQRATLAAIAENMFKRDGLSWWEKEID